MLPDSGSRYPDFKKPLKYEGILSKQQRLRSTQFANSSFAWPPVLAICDRLGQLNDRLYTLIHFDVISESEALISSSRFRSDVAKTTR